MKRGTQVKFLSTKGYLPAIVLDNLWDFGYLNLIVFDGNYHCLEFGIEKGNEINQWTYSNFKLDLTSKKDILKYYGVWNEEPEQNFNLNLKVENKPEEVKPAPVPVKRQFEQISFW